MRLEKTGIKSSLAALLALFLFISCSSQTEQISDNNSDSYQDPIDFDLEKIKERGSLIAVVDNSTTSYFIYRGKPMGYEYELLTRLSKSLGVDLEVVLTPNMEKAFDMLNKGEADIMAYHLTITRERSQKVAFTAPHNTVRQVLVQRKPDNWRDLKIHQIDASLIRNPIDLAGETVYVRKGSSFAERLNNLSDEIGADINMKEIEGDVDTENLINQVAAGEIEYTVADEDVAMINASYNADLDVKTDISFPQQIAWAVRKNAVSLKESVDEWLEQMKRKPDFYVIYDKYYKSSKSQRIRAASDYSSISKGKISPYDDVIIEAAEELDIDWLMLASIIFQESKFDPKVESWAGAKGLMQITSNVIEEYNVEDVYNPEENIWAVVKHLQWLMNYWEEDIIDPNERLKFILGAYNVGQGHVRDAMNLAKKFKKNPSNWEDVSKYLLLKSKPEYYNDPVVNYGYCRGSEPVNYVKQIINRYDQYKLFFSEEGSKADSTVIIEASLVH